MHLAFLTLYYPPDNESPGVFLEGVVERLVADGHRVTILCGGRTGAQSSEDVAGSAVATLSQGRSDRPGGTLVIRRVGSTRFGRRGLLPQFVDYATFYLGVAWALLWLRPRSTRLVAQEPPPYLSVVARIASRLRGGDHGHWVLDLYPDVLVAHGLLSEGGVVARTLGALSRWGYGGGRCAFVSTLGPDMAQRVGQYLPAGRRAAVVPLWETAKSRRHASFPSGQEEDDGDQLAEPGEELRAWRLERGWAEDELVLLYSGNMGLGHRFGEFLEAAALLGERNRKTEAPKLRFVFTGQGKRRREIEAFVKDHPYAPVELGDSVAREDLATHLASADVHLVSLEPAWDGTMVPSKFQGIFAVGRPVIFVGTETCAIGQWILASGGGWVVEPNNVEALKAAVDEARDPTERAKRGKGAWEFARQHFCREKNAGKLARIFAGTGGP